MKRIATWCVTGVAVIMGALLLFADVQIKDTAGGLQIGSRAGDSIGFHGATPVTQAVMSAAVTNTTPTNIVVTLQRAVITNLDLNGTTNIISYVTNVSVNSVGLYATTNQAGDVLTLLNQVRAALVAKGLVQ